MAAATTEGRRTREELREAEIIKLNITGDYFQKSDFAMNTAQYTGRCWCKQAAEVSHITTQAGLSFTEWECWRHYWERRITGAIMRAGKLYKQQGPEPDQTLNPNQTELI